MNEGDFSAKLGEILSDPARMEQIAKIARDIAGGQAPPPEPPSAPPPGGSRSLLPPGLLAGLTVHSRERTELLRAVRPFLEPERRGKLDRILSILRTLELMAVMQK
ncbi:MAG: hypothetical protein II776_03585 [Clostridia bacterium]|nr:hypothetical protein [Clostridia bacterium]